MYYYRARYYSPSLGRFLAQDPLGMPDGVNRYVYVRNNPVRWVDPLGLYDEEVHYILNSTLAWTAGFTSKQSTYIAFINTAVDQNVGLNYGPHFSSTAGAEQSMMNAIQSGSITAFAQALHQFQDSVSHAGYIWDPLHGKYGHVTTTLPDVYNPDSARDRSMTEGTLYWMERYIIANKRQ